MFVAALADAFPEVANAVLAEVARVLDVSPTTLWRKMKRLELVWP